MEQRILRLTRVGFSCQSFAIYNLSYLSLISRLTTTQWTAILKLKTWNRAKQVKYSCLYYFNKPANACLLSRNIHTLGPYLCRESFSWLLCHFFVQLLLNNNSSILQLKIKGALTRLPILVCQMKVQLVSYFLLYRNVLPTVLFSLAHEGFVFIFPIFYECSRGQISQVTII